MQNVKVNFDFMILHQNSNKILYCYALPVQPTTNRNLFDDLPSSLHLLYIRFCQNKIFDFIGTFYSNFHIGFIYVHPKRIPDINSIVG